MYSTIEPCSTVVLAALYLRGGPRPFEVKRSAWPQVVRALRFHPAPLGSASKVLRSAGLWTEALALEASGLLAWAEQTALSGRSLTAEDPGYPWSINGPPALWRLGELPAGPYVAIVGSREVGREHLEFARGCGKVAASLGFSVVSGGASGCDRAAMEGASVTMPSQRVEILPYGLAHLARAPDGCCLTVCAPDELFSTASAMERNGLIYSLGQAAVVVHARFKAGGTWHGAVEAHRRKLTRLIVKQEPTNPAHRALAAMGAIPLASPAGLAEALAAAPAQPKLVG